MGRAVHSVRAIALGICLLAATGCATTTYSHRIGDHRLGDAICEPFRDSGWTRETPPELLIRAADAPYASPTVLECSALLNEISALDLVLGPDLDVAGEHEDESDLDGSGLLSGAIGGVLGLAYRSIVRRISGAAGRERVPRDAIFAGMVRRAFLKGVAHGACVSAAADTGVAAPITLETAPTAVENSPAGQL